MICKLTETAIIYNFFKIIFLLINSLWIDRKKGFRVSVFKKKIFIKIQIKNNKIVFSEVTKDNSYLCTILHLYICDKLKKKTKNSEHKKRLKIV